MSSLRLQIRNAMIAAIDGAISPAVHGNLDYAIEEGKLPACAVQTDGDADQMGQPGNRSETSADIGVHYLVKNSADPETEADQYEVAGHAALFADPRFGGLATRLERLGGTFNFDMGDFCDRTVNYRVWFRTSLNNLETSA